jgi:hypothetical protein
MFLGVGQQLLQQPVGGGAHGRIHDRGCGGQSGVDIDAGPPVPVDQIVDPGEVSGGRIVFQGIGVGVDAPEDLEDPLCFQQHRLNTATCGVQSVPGGGVRCRSVHFDDSQMNSEYGDFVADHVVQVAGDPETFLGDFLVAFRLTAGDRLHGQALGLLQIPAIAAQGAANGGGGQTGSEGGDGDGTGKAFVLCEEDRAIHAYGDQGSEQDPTSVAERDREGGERTERPDGDRVRSQKGGRQPAEDHDDRPRPEELARHRDTDERHQEADEPSDSESCRSEQEGRQVGQRCGHRDHQGQHVQQSGTTRHLVGFAKGVGGEEEGHSFDPDTASTVACTSDEVHRISPNHVTAIEGGSACRPRHGVV